MLSATRVKTETKIGRHSDGRRGNGLSLLIKPAADGGLRKVWTQRVHVNGRWRNLGLGRYPIVTLSEAREQALANARDAYQGIDPLEVKRYAASIPTFASATEAAIVFYAEGWRENGRSAERWRQVLQDYAFPRIGKLKLDVVTSGDVLGCVAPLWTTKHSTATRLLHGIEKVLARGVAEGHVTANVAKGEAIDDALPRHKPVVVNRVALKWTELAEALRRIDEGDAMPTAKLAIRMLALTAARSNEVRGMRWEEVDGSTWTVPPERTKVGKEHRIPLSPEAMAVLMQAQPFSDGSGFVFPGKRGTPFGDSALMVYVKRSGQLWTLHGFRSAFRTWCDELGHDGQLAEFSLGHVVGTAAERAYRRGDLYERRALLMAEWERVAR